MLPYGVTKPQWIDIKYGSIALDNKKLYGGKKILSPRVPEGQLENHQISYSSHPFWSLIYG